MVRAVVVSIVLIVGVLLVSFSGDCGYCGNRKMVESRVEELKEMNERLLQKTGFPRYGKVFIKAKVFKVKNGYKFKVYKRQVVETRSLTFNNSRDTVKREDKDSN